MAGRLYTAQFSRTAITALVDLFEILAASNMAIELLRVNWSQDTEFGDAADEQLNIQIARVTGAPTSGSGGSSPTPRPVLQGDAAAVTTVEVLNTTQLVGGTSVVLWSESFNIRAGFDWYVAPSDRFIFQPSTRCVIGLAPAPADSITASGSVLFAELG